MARFKQITIIGLGLIGGSLGMTIRRRRLAGEVIGWSRRTSTLTQAQRLGAIDDGVASFTQAVRDADLVVVATPVDSIVPTARRAARFMRPESILTDVGSTKDSIVHALSVSLPNHVTFVGAHPLAGSEQRGLAAASPHLFDGATCLLTPTSHTPRHALERVARFWKALGATVQMMDPTAHDRLLAAVSHVPHLMAFALVNATDHKALRVAPRSFLEATRVAKSDPDLWDDIFLSNRTALVDAMDQFESQWKTFRRLLSTSDRRTLRRWLANAKRRRDSLPDA